MSTKIVHFTDLEGDWHHLEQNIDALNKEYDITLSIAGEGEASYLQIPEGVSVVFGGDLIDKGRYDLDLLHLFNNTKQRFPEQLTLIAGNRDLNKLRWPLEVNDTHPMALLKEESLKLTAAELKAGESTTKTGYDRLSLGLTWVDGGKGKKTFTAFCNEKLSYSIDVSEDHPRVPSSDELKVLYAQWMFAQTMGAPAAWTLRKEYFAEKNLRRRNERLGAPFAEISKEELKSEIETPTLIGEGYYALTEEAIFNSFSEEFSPIGPVARYLQSAVLAEKRANVGFTHGALNALSFHPVLDDEQKHFTSFDALVAGLKSWFSDFVLQYYQRVQAPDFGQSEEDQKLLVKKQQVDLMSLPAQATTDTQKGTSTVVTNHYMKNGMMLPIDEAFRAPLEASKVCILVAGHQPHANIPGFASQYQQADEELVKGLQAVVTDSCNNRQGQSAALTLIEEMPDEVSYVHRFARDSEGNTLVKTKTPGFDCNGYVYDQDGWPFDSKDLLHSPELLVGSKTIRVLDEYYRSTPRQNKLLNEGWEITAFYQDTMTFTLCKVGSVGEDFQIASINLPADQVYGLIEKMEADADMAKNEKKRKLAEVSSEEANDRPMVRELLRHSAFPPPVPPVAPVADMRGGADEILNIEGPRL